MHENMLEKAEEVGRMLGQTQEYKALQKAREQLNEDRDTVERVNRLAELEREISSTLQKGEEPPEETQKEYESAFSELQSGSQYQAVVAAQSNFDRLLQKVNERIGEGMKSGSESSIIMPS